MENLTLIVTLASILSFVVGVLVGVFLVLVLQMTNKYGENDR